MEQWWPPMEKVAGPVFLREWTPADLAAIEAASQDPYIPRITAVPGSYTTAAVGYWVLAEERGRGYAKAALALLPQLAAQLGLRRLEALIERDNLASQTTARAVGFAPSPQGNRTERIGGQDREMRSFLMELSPPAAAGRLVPHDR